MEGIAGACVLGFDWRDSICLLSYASKGPRALLETGNVAGISLYEVVE